MLRRLAEALDDLQGQRTDAAALAERVPARQL